MMLKQIFVKNSASPPPESDPEDMRVLQLFLKPGIRIISMFNAAHNLNTRSIA
jgi:hypothetical protein